MGGGGLMQLVSFGAQDVYLTSNPTVTFFRAVSRRHTAFASEAVENVFSGNVAPGKRVVATVARVSDLLGETWLEVTLTKGAGTSFFAAESLIQSATLDIGGTQIDQINNHTLRLFSELFRSGEEKAAYAAAVDFAETDAPGTVRTFYVPLCFSYCRAAANFLPVVALQFHEIRISINLASTTDMAKVGVDTSATAQFGVKLMTDAVWLDADERKRTAQSSHELLVQQFQVAEETIKISATGKSTTNVRLAINHPVFLQAWYVRDADIAGKTWGGPLVHSTKVPTDEKVAPLSEVRLTFNGHDRVSRKASYFGTQQPLQYFKTNPQAGIGMYSYALRPSDPTHPSGSVNCSRIDHIAATITTKKASAATANAVVIVDDETISDAATQLQTFTFVSMNYNVLRVVSGMGGLAFAN